MNNKALQERIKKMMEIENRIEYLEYIINMLEPDTYHHYKVWGELMKLKGESDEIKRPQKQLVRSYTI